MRRRSNSRAAGYGIPHVSVDGNDVGGDDNHRDAACRSAGRDGRRAVGGRGHDVPLARPLKDRRLPAPHGGGGVAVTLVTLLVHEALLRGGGSGTRRSSRPSNAATASLQTVAVEAARRCPASTASPPWRTSSCARARQCPEPAASLAANAGLPHHGRHPVEALHAGSSTARRAGLPRRRVDVGANGSVVRPHPRAGEGSIPGCGTRRFRGDRGGRTRRAKGRHSGDARPVVELPVCTSTSSACASTSC